LLTGVLTLNDKYKLKLKGCDQAGTLRLDGEPTGNTDYSLLWILNNEKVFNKACKEGIDFLFNELFMHENQPCGFLIRKKARTLQYVGNRKGIFHFIGLAIKTACYAQYQTEYIVYKTKTEDTYEFNLKGIISEKDFTYTDIQGKFTSIKQDIISGNLSFSSGKIKVEIEFYNIPEYTEYLTSIKYKTLQIANPFSTNITAANFKERVEIGYDSVRSLLVDLQYLLEKKDMGYIKDKKYWKLNKVSDFFEYLQYLKETKRVIKADYETTGLKINSKSRTREADRMVGLAISVNKLMKTDHLLDSKYKDVNYYIPVYHTDMENIFTELTDSEKEKILSDIDGFHYDTGKKDELKQAIEDDDLTEVNDWIMMGYLKPILEEKELANANVSFDWKVGYIYGIDSNFCEDSQLAAQLLIHKYPDYGLKELTYTITGRKVLDLEDFSPVGDWGKMPFTFRDLPEDYVLAYAPADVDNLDEILAVLNKELEETNQTITYAIEIGFAKCIGYQEFWGYHMPPNEVDKLDAELLEEKDRLLDIIYWGAGKTFNMDSPAQLLEVLQSKGHEITSTKKEVLNQLYEDDFILAIKEYRTISQMIKLFIKPLPEQMDKYGNIYPSTMSMGARTGRTSASKPNYQQANDWVRKYIKAREGYYLVDSDLSQIEYRVTATLSKQEALLEMFKDFEKDYHTYQTSRMFKIPYELVQKSLRKQAKAINFGLPFGMGDSTLGYNIFGKRNNETKMKAAGLRKVYFEGQEKVLHFFEDTRDRAVQNGYTTTAFKRRRYYDFIKYSVNSIRKQAGNAVIQGCLDGDTRIQTKELGIVRIKDVVNKHMLIWTGNIWSYGDILYSGKKRKCVVTFNTGQKFICSPSHKFLVRSHRGDERFIECRNLLTKEHSTNPHRVVVNNAYEPSDFIYSSARARDDHFSYANNSNNVFVDSMLDSFEAGRVLGRLASDGSIVNCEDGGCCVTQFIAEHELGVGETLLDCMKPLTDITVSDLDIKRGIHGKIFMDTELLRGFLRGLFDGDGGISGKTITLTFGNNLDFEIMCRDVQKALLFFGVRSRYYRYPDRSKIVIGAYDTQKFLDVIGFVNATKNQRGRELKCVKDEHIFGRVLIPETVEITDEYIDMYDVCNTDDGYYVADGIVTHNTAADIFKLNCIRMMYHIKKYDLWDKVKMLAFVHDEILLEVRNDINPYFIQWLVRECMEYDYKGFCPVFCGVGFGHSWYEAKSDLSELNTQAGHQLYSKADSIYWEESEHYTSGDVVELMGREIKAYKIRYLTDYMMNPDNMDKVIRPYAYAMLQDTNKGYYVGDLLIDGANVDKSSLQLKSALTLNEPTKDGLEGLLESFITVYMSDIEPTSIKIIDPESIKEEVKEEAIKDKEIMLLEDIHIGGITGDDYLLTMGYYADSEQLILNLAGLDIGKIEAIKRFIIKHRDEDEDYLVKLVYMTQDKYKEIKEFAIGYQYSRKLMDYVLKNRTLESIMA